MTEEKREPTNADLESRLRELDNQLAEIRQAPQRFVDEGHRRIDNSVAGARILIEQALTESNRRIGATDSPVIPGGLGDAYALLDPEIQEIWHRTLDDDQGTERGGKHDLTYAGFRRGETRADYEARRDAITAEMRKIELELSIRDAREHQQEAAERTKQLEEEMSNE